MSSRRRPASPIASAATSAHRPSMLRFGQERLCGVSPMPTIAALPLRLISSRSLYSRTVIKREIALARLELDQRPLGRDVVELDGDQHVDFHVFPGTANDVC